MNKTELINKMVEKMNEETDATIKLGTIALKAFTDSITEALQAGDKVQITGFGTFEPVDKPARKGINPKTLEAIDIEAKRVPKFKPGASLKESVNK